MQQKAQQYTLGYSSIKNASKLIQESIEKARLRQSVVFGSTQSDPLTMRIPLPNVSSGKVKVDETSPQEIIASALAIREVVEWAGWREDTAFPPVREFAASGEPLGQCLVTARFAKNYFHNAKLAEVRVKQNSGKIVGPHIILVLPSKNYGPIALDLTPDQRLALGSITHAVRETLPQFKVNMIPLNHPDCPYEIVAYQSDSILATKRSQPLEHTRLLIKSIALSKGYHMIEDYAQESTIKDFQNIHEFSSLNNSKVIQFGKIEKQAFSPSPKWIWETLGLAGYRKAVILHKGFIQEVLLYDNETIYIMNLSGVAPVTYLEDMSERMEVKKLSVLPGRSLLQEFNERKKLTGPILVESRYE